MLFLVANVSAFVIGGLGAHVKELRPDEVVVTLKVDGFCLC